MRSFYICIEQTLRDMATTLNNRNAKAIIKFIYCDFASGTTTLMSGLNLITIQNDDYRVLQKLSNERDSGLERISPQCKPTVWKFNARNAHRVEGCIKASIVMEILKVGGQLI